MIRRRVFRRSRLPLLLAGCLLLAAPAAAQFGKNLKIQYEDFDWKIYHSTHFDIYYYPDEAHLLQKVASFAESGYDHLSREFDFQIKEPINLIFYETHSDFEQTNVIDTFIPEGVGAFATPVRSRMVLPVDLPDAQLMELVLHELTHIFQFHMLFGGSLAKGVSQTPPQWFMEGMASYMAQDESARDRMFLRDAVVNDRLPSVTGGAQGFFAYRFGHAVFDFIEERWGKEGFRDFIIEVRNTLGGRVGRAIERTFQMPAEDFDREFRRWLRGRYLPELVETGEPGDFGRPFRVEAAFSQDTSPAASPSGDLVASFSTLKGEVDVVLYDARNRTLLKNLTKGFSSEFQYFVAQELTLGRKSGRDLAFSPDGNSIALFARKGKGRALVLLDALRGKIQRTIPTDVEQQFNPAFHPDGRRVAFSGHRNGQFDLWLLDLETEELTQLTDDAVYDAAPVFTPDGEGLVFTSVVAGNEKIFRLPLDDPQRRVQLTFGESDDTDPVYSSQWNRIYYTSDRTGANNIYSLDLDSGEIRQHTNAVTGTFMPTVLPSPTGGERLVYTAFWKGRFDLYLLDIADPLTEAAVLAEAPEMEPQEVDLAELPRYEPAIEVIIDDANKDRYSGRKFFLEDVGANVGVSDDNVVVGQTFVSFSDFMGDRRILAAFQSIESFQNFDVFYLNLRKRLQWRVHAFDDNDFFLAFDPREGNLERGRNVFSQTGARITWLYPFDFYHRVEFGGGAIARELDFLTFTETSLSAALAPLLTEEQLAPLVEEGVLTPEIEDILRNALGDGFFTLVDAADDSLLLPAITRRDDEYPILEAALVGDTTTFAPWGPVAGRRWRLGGYWAPDLDESGTLTQSINVDLRQYIPLTARSSIAFRSVGFFNDGNAPDPVFFGGLNTVRGFDLFSIVGDNGFFTNLEVRFPLIDRFDLPFVSFGGIRGVIFLDVAGAWFNDFQSFDLWDEENDRLEDAISSYGWGFSIRLFGLDVNWTFSKIWDFQETDGSFRTEFWIGPVF